MEVFDKIFFSGFNVETVEYKNISFTVWDVGGQVCFFRFIFVFSALNNSLYRTKSDHFGDITTKIPKALYSSSTRMIEIVSMLLAMSCTACLTRMSSEIQSCLSLPTNKICQMPWVLPRWLINWAFTDSATDSGTSRLVAPPLAMDFTKVWTGCPPLCKRENKHAILLLLCSVIQQSHELVWIASWGVYVKFVYISGGCQRHVGE